MEYAIPWSYSLAVSVEKYVKYNGKIKFRLYIRADEKIYEDKNLLKRIDKTVENEYNKYRIYPIKECIYWNCLK